MKFPNNLLDSIRKKLEREKRLAANRLTSLDESDPFSDPSRLSDNASIDTDAKEEEGHDRIEALKKAVSQKISGIERALKRLKKGAYGVCERCGKPIEAKRLEIMPTAILCVTCERERERKL